MSDIKKILDNAKNRMTDKGADKGQIFVTESEAREFNVESGEFTLFRTVFTQDINIIVYKNQRKGAYYTNRLDDEAVNNAVDMAVTSAESGEQDEAYDIAPYQGKICADKGVYEPDTDMLFTRTKELIDHIAKNYPKIVIKQLIVHHNRRHMVFANTNGTFCDEYTGSYGISLGIAAHEGDTTTSLRTSFASTDNLNKPFIDLGNIRNHLKITEAQLDMEPMEGKFTGTMVVMPDSIGTFISSLGSIVGDYSILNGTSIWLDKLGEQVADKRVTIKIDPNDEHIVGGETISFDGFKSEPYFLIKEGRLESFMIDQYTANKTGYRRAENGSFSVVMEKGDMPIEQIIKSIDRGIIVGGFSGGQPGINGDFSGVAKNSFLIENGRIAKPVTEVMINGNIADMFMNLAGISEETVCDGYDVLPYMAFNGIIVSGK